jgi:hypothetical protein
MALALDAPFAASEPRAAIRTGALAVPALASLGAGAIHAAAIGVHSEHDQAVLTFALVGGAQLGAGALGLTTSRRFVGAAIAAVNAVAIGGFVLAKRSGISFIDGMEAKEAVQWADGLAAGFAVAAVLGTILAVARGMRFPGGAALTRVLAVPVAILALTGMVAAGNHAHAAGDEHHGAAATDDHHAAEASTEPAAAVPARPFIPGEPIDLGGVPGVTPAQQAEAENILAATLYYLPRWADFRVAEAEGWKSIGDGVTGHEHFVNPATKGDGKILDPTAPESLVYSTEGGKRTLVAAMFQLDSGTTMADVPDVGGALMQWHIHDNLCFTADAQVAALRAPGAPCPAGLFIGGEEPMIHVWITPHRCGPFSALDGIGAGTVAAGETKLCDHAHGHSEAPSTSG